MAFWDDVSGEVAAWIGGLLMRLCSGLLCERTAGVWMRGKPWCTSCCLKRFGVPMSRSGAAPAGLGAPVSDSRPPGAEPLPLTADELQDILESDGWHEVEFDLWTRFGVDRDDIERMLERNA